MCCFSQPVVSVSATNIFARPAEEGRQFLVYSMTLKAKTDLAMVLPLPVKAGTDEKGVSFIDLSEYAEFFDDLLKGFPVPVRASRGGASTFSAAPPPAAMLEVVKVGSFEASFVPTLKDFSRLDERFRISDAAWKQLPEYRDHGFAVFKLKSGEAKVHPMAFSFPRKDPKTLFFPTVHIHDGKVHAKAKFDHALYCQPSESERPTIHDWQESGADARRFMAVEKTKGLILGDQHCYQKKLHGMLPNRDTLVSTFA
jgi:hypothetical protein